MKTYFLFVFISLSNLNYQPCLKIKSDKQTYTHGKGEIIIEIQNCSDGKEFFFISLNYKSDTGWVKIISNIDNLNRNQIFALYELNPGNKYHKALRIEDIPEEYFEGKSNLFRLKVYYSNNRKTVGSVFFEKCYDFNVISE